MPSPVTYTSAKWIPNAFALPGGFIFMTRGMMNLIDSEADLVAVLGHEIGWKRVVTE